MVGRGVGVHWLVAAGLAKGEHQDRGDFYQRVQRENGSGGSAAWLPTVDDVRLLKGETAARLVIVWELNIQRNLLNALREIHSGGTVRIDITPGTCRREGLRRRDRGRSRPGRKL